MAILDIILLLCFVPAIVGGISKGFIKEVIDLAAILIAAWAAFHFATPAADWMAKGITLDPAVLKVIAFCVIAIAVALLLNLVSALITKALEAISLGLVNRILGMVFSIIKVAFLLGLFIMLLETLNSSLHIFKPELTESSVVYCTLRDLANHIFPILKTFIAGAADSAAVSANV